MKAKVRDGKQAELAAAIEKKTLGRGSVAGGEYLRNMREARIAEDGKVSWVEVCFCSTPLDEERPFWEEFFELTEIKDAHARRNCRDVNGTESWACVECTCTERLESRMKTSNRSFLKVLTENHETRQINTARKPV